MACSTCSGSCEYGCSYDCTNACNDTCESGCRGGCEGQCQSACWSGCTGDCSKGCAGDCSGCDGCSGCGSGCANGCYGSCTTTCGQGCGAGCSTACTGTCMTKCNDSCSANNAADVINNFASNIKKGEVLNAQQLLEVKNAVIYEFNRRIKSGYSSYSVPLQKWNGAYSEHGKKIYTDLQQFNIALSGLSLDKGNVADAASIIKMIEEIKRLMREKIAEK